MKLHLFDAGYERIRDEKLKGSLIRLKVLEGFLTDEECCGYGKRWIVESRYSVFKRLFS